ncbi:MAG: AbrB/MazE/SpoVT family DNA-binding domain-containing protein [Chloroflexota bacterium]|nr:MAG: AbrB/MazE/SpoVT family DNA-binding domain-containing protein [Chloroflexota bacterium]
MKELLSTVTSKGQVTIPAEIRRMLRVSPHDKIAFVVEDDEVRIARRGSVVAQTAGVLKTDQPPLSAEKLREAAEQAIAEDVSERMGG